MNGDSVVLAGPFHPTELMERASIVLESAEKTMSKTSIANDTGGRTEHAKLAVERLAEESHIVDTAVGKYPQHTLVTPYRKLTDPLLQPSED